MVSLPAKQEKGTKVELNAKTFVPFYVVVMVGYNSSLLMPSALIRE